MMKQSPLISNNQTNTIMNQQSSSLTAAFNGGQIGQKRNSSSAMDNQNQNQNPPSKQTYSVNPAQAGRVNQIGASSSMNQAHQISDEQRFKSDRTGISNNSFERASKTYYLHQ